MAIGFVINGSVCLFFLLWIGSHCSDRRTVIW